MSATGDALRVWRTENKMSRQKLADACGLSMTKIANIETGREPRPDELQLLMQVVPNLSSPPEPDDESSAQDLLGEVQQQLIDEGVQGESGTVGPQPVPVAASPAFSNSELQTWKRCKRKWWFAFYRRLGLKEREATSARSRGNRVHAALAGWYGTDHINPYETLAETIAHDLDEFPQQAPEIQKEADLCQAMLEGYFDWIAETGADQGLQVLGSEQTIEVPLEVNGSSVLLRGRLDLRTFREQDGARFFLDHKTVGNLTEPVRMLHMDEQMLMYHLLEYLDAVANGRPIDALMGGGLYNMLRAVKRTSQAKPPFYERVEVRHNAEELRNFYIRVHGEISDIISTRGVLDAGQDPKWTVYPSPRRDCTWDCAFLPVCPLVDDGSNVEGLITQLYDEIDPYARYADDRGSVPES